MKKLEFKSVIVGALGLGLILAVTAAGPNKVEEAAIEYQVVEYGSTRQLQGRVQEMMSQGWRPQGGPGYTGPNGSYFQALVR